MSGAVQYVVQPYAWSDDTGWRALPSRAFPRVTPAKICADALVETGEAAGVLLLRVAPGGQGEPEIIEYVGELPKAG